MTVTQRGNSWQATVTFKGTRKRKDFPTQAQAEAWEAQTLADFKNGRIQPKSAVPVPANDATLEQLLDKVTELRWRGSKAERTTLINARLVVKVLGPKRLASSLNKDDVVFLKEHFRAEGNAVSTINRKLSAFSTLRKEANEFGYLDAVFKAGISREKGRGRKRYVTREEEPRMLAWCQRMAMDALHDYIVIGLDTGFRQAEILRIAARDVSPDMTNLWTYDTKNGDNREVPVTRRTKEVLLRRAKGLHPLAPLFDCSGAKILDDWNSMMDGLGMVKAEDRQFVPHSTRHAYITRLLEAGVDIKTVQELAGHKNITTTQGYAHTSPERKMMAVSRLEGFGVAA